VGQHDATSGAHAVLRRRNISPLKRRRFRPDFSQIAPKFRLYSHIALPHFLALRSFVSDDQPVAAAMPAAHDVRAKFCDPASNLLRYFGVLC